MQNLESRNNQLLINRLHVIYDADLSGISCERFTQVMHAVKSDTHYEVNYLMPMKNYEHGIVVYPRGNPKRKIYIKWKPRDRINTPIGFDFLFAQIECSPRHHDNHSIKSALDWIAAQSSDHDVLRLLCNPVVMRVDFVCMVYGSHAPDLLLGLDTGVATNIRSLDSRDVSARSTSNESRTKVKLRLHPCCRFDQLDKVCNPWIWVSLYSSSAINDDRLPMWFRILLRTQAVDTVMALVDSWDERESIYKVLAEHELDLFDPVALWQTYSFELLKLSSFNLQQEKTHE